MRNKIKYRDVISCFIHTFDELRALRRETSCAYSSWPNAYLLKNSHSEQFRAQFSVAFLFAYESEISSYEYNTFQNTKS